MRDFIGGRESTCQHLLIPHNELWWIEMSPVEDKEFLPPSSPRSCSAPAARLSCLFTNQSITPVVPMWLTKSSVLLFPQFCSLKIEQWWNINCTRDKWQWWNDAGGKMLLLHSNGTIVRGAVNCSLGSSQGSQLTLSWALSGRTDRSSLCWYTRSY